MTRRPECSAQAAAGTCRRGGIAAYSCILVVVTTMLTGCKTGHTVSPAVVRISVRDKLGQVPVTNVLLSAVHPLSRACTSLFPKKSLYIVNTIAHYAWDDERTKSVSQ